MHQAEATRGTDSLQGGGQYTLRPDPHSAPSASFRDAISRLFNSLSCRASANEIPAQRRPVVTPSGPRPERSEDTQLVSPLGQPGALPSNPRGPDFKNTLNKIRLLPRDFNLGL